MTFRKIGALIGLALGAMSLPGIAMAQQSLAEYARDGQREIVLTAITSPDVDVDERAPDGSTALLWATYAVDRELVRALLDAGATVNVTNEYGTSPLIEAVKLGDVALVDMLLAAGADADSPNHDNQTALMLAAAIGSREIAERLIEHGADVTAVESFRGQNALMWAAGEGHPEIVDLLLANGADQDLDRRAVHDDWPRQMTSEPRAQFRQTGGLTALLYATRSGCYRCVVAIVEAGADIERPNPDGITPLLNAIDARNFDIAMYLIDQGANVHVWDMHGRTPLYMAVDMNSFRGNGGAAGGGILPLRDAQPQNFGAMDVVHRLLDIGVDANHQLTRMRPNGPG
ncbi:MAG: ankyrin repeat domain-containing protein, partial [Gammaproteobacteria bacterium]|nr:ankyrin repeat domain-containing protein [Gammaproteobacteria bacterium]